jgi:TRAP-type C4-dicarboxylate transport system permease small subunit
LTEPSPAAAPGKGSSGRRLPLVDRISLGLGEWLSLLFVVAIVLTVYEVVARYAFNAPTIWVHDMVIVLSATCFMFGGPMASQQRAHIQMASYFDNAPRPIRRALDLVCQILTAAFLAMFLYGSVRLAVPSLELMETSGRAWDVPIPAYLKTIVVLGSALMLWQTLSHIRHRASMKPEHDEIVL